MNRPDDRTHSELDVPKRKLTPAESELLQDTLGTDDSAPTDRTEPPPATVDPIPDTLPGVLYAWQMLNDEGVWNIIAVQGPFGTMPMITTSFNTAWEGMGVAQEHANQHRCRCRLACFGLSSELAIVEPET